MNEQEYQRLTKKLEQSNRNRLNALNTRNIRRYRYWAKISDNLWEKRKLLVNIRKENHV